MESRAVLVAGLIAISACHGGANAPSPPAPAATPASTVRRDVLVTTGASFSPVRGDSARRAFVPEILAEESGGECSINRTGGSGATIVLAYYPARVKALMQVNITFDSSGRLVRYFERRGIPDMSTSKGLKIEQLDSLIRAQEAKTRSTTVSLDYAIDQGIAMNRGGDKPTKAVIGSVREIEQMEKLGSPKARLDHVRKLCGV